MFKYIILLCSLAACGTYEGDDVISDDPIATESEALTDFLVWQVVRVQEGRLERWDGTWEPVAGELVIETESDTVAIHVEAPAGGGARVRVFDGSWSAWSSDVATIALPAPAEGTAAHTLVIETRTAGAIGVTHGYIKIKKLNSGG